MPDGPKVNADVQTGFSRCFNVGTSSQHDPESTRRCSGSFQLVYKFPAGQDFQDFCPFLVLGVVANGYCLIEQGGEGAPEVNDGGP